MDKGKATGTRNNLQRSTSRLTPYSKHRRDKRNSKRDVFYFLIFSGLCFPNSISHRGPGLQPFHMLLCESAHLTTNKASVLSWNVPLPTGTQLTQNCPGKDTAPPASLIFMGFEEISLEMKREPFLLDNCVAVTAKRRNQLICSISLWVAPAQICTKGGPRPATAGQGC